MIEPTREVKRAVLLLLRAGLESKDIAEVFGLRTMQVAAYRAWITMKNPKYHALFSSYQRQILQMLRDDMSPQAIAERILDDISPQYYNLPKDRLKERFVPPLTKLIEYIRDHPDCNPFLIMDPPEIPYEPSPKIMSNVLKPHELELQQAIRAKIDQLEPGLHIVDEGKEFYLPAAGRIDITARDRHGRYVAIEIKNETADSDALVQLLHYMGSLKSTYQDQEVRGILIAPDFDEEVILAVNVLPNVQLKSYRLDVSFEDVTPDV